ncbi:MULTISPECIES: hypothetical protein [Ferrimonas]|uniref:hypothetical protein n=1 Tax=Ferrimonas TaxID=44011 RepID=UPI00041756F0|nr:MULTISPECIES: hypothetical protein [Ferrimonas]USD37046.1 hypothetical protein J8Z22_18935 [Ferrimonas sp. SCSIO 43195]
MAEHQSGVERRSIHRRQTVDRRQYIRWEPGKAERRHGGGRRREDGPFSYPNQ